jgi:hypothetical protein
MPNLLLGRLGELARDQIGVIENNIIFAHNQLSREDFEKYMQRLVRNMEYKTQSIRERLAHL